ncbi:LysR substrate-binding domain-containing protein [Roseovarius atlanticus]|uniref:LysR substrate-binding domain-containing protein n=1 Tax=Roseovarius atlanticus TaxID=1641875 RepID=UPI001C96F648|nr:LysR substrate-binding domain-containing protein [Roseovarius atlanticus]MBY5989129.1 LysR family transcriptional regulator [Roseovarius atlanticus]MBY6124521.1 LysR family transcriptional regulator [Roseovarius atlanticus]MBY6149016.1 LysR family transcriptional regulator [Roseovarius atlanticus]
MRRRIPSNSMLIAFEAAARHGSFKEAASELLLTESAVSRQIARLETFLETKLFERKGNRVRLLPVGTKYAQEVGDSLARLERDSQRLMGQSPGTVDLEIGVLPTFATRWLIPRLGMFQNPFPHIRVNLAQRLDPFNLPASGFDAAIHFHDPAWAGLVIHPLLHEVLIPVCSPSLLSGTRNPPPLDDLPRVHRRQNAEAWQIYAQETGQHLQNPLAGVRFDLHGMAIEAAMAGLGVALVPRTYVERDLAEGRLVTCWPPGQSVSKTFCAITTEPLDECQPALRSFVLWLLDQAAATEDRP